MWSLGLFLFLLSMPLATMSDDNKLLARLKEGNATLEFRQVDPGELIMTYLAPMDSGHHGNKLRGSKLPDFDEEDLLPTEMYVRFSGGNKKDVPAALLAAEAQVMEHNRMHHHQPPDDDEQHDDDMMLLEPEQDPKKVPGDDEQEGDRRLCPGGLGRFCNQFKDCTYKPKGCSRKLGEVYQDPGGSWPDCDYDFWICMTERTGSGTIGDYAYRLTSYVVAYRGTVCHKLQRKSWGKWRHDGSSCVPQGYYSKMSAYGVHLKWRAKTYDAAGDGYHWKLWNYG